MERYEPPEPVTCEHCGSPRYWRGLMGFGKPRWTYLEPCNCDGAITQREREAKEEAEREALKRDQEAQKRLRDRVEYLMGQSGLGRRFKARRFDSFEQTSDNVGAYNACVGFVNGFKAMQKDADSVEKNGLFLYGSKGTGKTHLAASIANELIEQGVPVVFATMIDLLGKLKESFEESQKGKRESDILRIFTEADLLIIDDFGKEQPTEWALTKIYQIVNARYEDYKPIIVTSNYSSKQLVERLTPKSGDPITADATIDRILEMTYGVPLSGKSWRTI